jgi:hypothetical protein
MMQAAQNGRGMVPASRATVAASAYGIPPESGISIKDFLSILRRRRMIILVTIFLVTGLATLLGLQLTRRYTATAELLIKPPDIQVVDLQSVSPDRPPDPFAVETQLDVMRSDSHAQRVIQALGLLSDPEFNPFVNPDSTQSSRPSGITNWISRHWPATVSEASHLVPSLVAAPGEEANSQDQPQPTIDGEHRNSADYKHQMTATVDRLLQGLQINQNTLST